MWAYRTRTVLWGIYRYFVIDNLPQNNVLFKARQRKVVSQAKIENFHIIVIYFLGRDEVGDNIQGVSYLAFIYQAILFFDSSFS